MTDLSQLEVPGPTVSALTKPFWDAAANRRLLIQKCGACGLYVFYPRPMCPHCWEPALEWTEVSGQGSLKSFSEIWKPGHPGWIPATPYLVGLVELAEGPTMMSHILAKGNDVSVGDALVFEPLNVGGRTLPVFRKALGGNDK